MLLVITGPTASGKTARAVSAAKMLGGEIISADSRQLYRGMDLGTGKDLDEYGNVPYHLIDIAPAGERLNLHRWLQLYHVAVNDIQGRDRVPVLCGGTGLYIESALNGIVLPEVPENKELRQSLKGLSLGELTEILAKMKRLHNVTDTDTCQRAIRAIEIETYYNLHPDQRRLTSPHRRTDAVIVGVDIDRDSRRARIADRLHRRLDNGMVDEVRSLIDSGVSPEDLIYYGLEYKYLTLYVTGQLTYEQMTEQLLIAIQQFAKRQMTWFRGMERRGFTIHWLPYDLSEDDFNSEITRLCASYL